LTPYGSEDHNAHLTKAELLLRQRIDHDDGVAVSSGRERIPASNAKWRSWNVSPFSARCWVSMDRRVASFSIPPPAVIADLLIYQRLSNAPADVPNGPSGFSIRRMAACALSAMSSKPKSRF
jgi:hypothetical protein